jgi:gliding motility-associated-like protein
MRICYIILGVFWSTTTFSQRFFIHQTTGLNATAFTSFSDGRVAAFCQSSTAGGPRLNIFDPGGHLIQSNTLGLTQNDAPAGIFPLKNNRYMLVSNPINVWANIFSNAVHFMDETGAVTKGFHIRSNAVPPIITNVKEVSDGYLLIGHFGTPTNIQGPLLLKMDFNGAIVWQYDPLTASLFTDVIELPDGQLAYTGKFSVYRFVGILNPLQLTTKSVVYLDNEAGKLAAQPDNSLRVYATIDGNPGYLHLNNDLSIRGAKKLSGQFGTAQAVWYPSSDGQWLLGHTQQLGDTLNAVFAKVTPDLEVIWANQLELNAGASHVVNGISQGRDGSVIASFRQGNLANNNQPFTGGLAKIPLEGGIPACCANAVSYTATAATEILVATYSLGDQYLNATFISTPLAITTTATTPELKVLCPYDQEIELSTRDTCPSSCILVGLPRFTDGVLYQWTFDGATPGSFTGASPGNVCFGPQEGVYTIRIEAEGCFSDTAQVRIAKRAVQFPNAFTPNGDGLNDFFGPVSDCAPNNFTLEVFNRWGQKIFTTTDVERGWNGQVNGADAPMDVYFWRAGYTLLRNGQPEPVATSGDVTLIR